MDSEALNSLQNMHNLLKLSQSNIDREDTIWWAPSTNEGFMVKSCYEYLIEQIMLSRYEP